MKRNHRPAPISRTEINVLPISEPKPGARRPYPERYKFIVTGPQPGGRRWRKFFDSRDRADAYAHLRRVELSNVGTQGAALSASQRAEYLDCTRDLEPYGITLRQAVEMLLPTLAARRATVPVEKVVADMLKAQVGDGSSKRHIADLRARLGKLAQAFPSRELGSV